MALVLMVALAIVVLATNIRSVNSVPYVPVVSVAGISVCMALFAAVAMKMANRFQLKQVLRLL